jgi:hypothetical protein
MLSGRSFYAYGDPMRMIAGSILILAAAVLVSAYWLGRVMHNSVVVGSPESIYLIAAAGFLALFGGSVAAIGLVSDREERRRDS